MIFLLNPLRKWPPWLFVALQEEETLWYCSSWQPFCVLLLLYNSCLFCLLFVLLSEKLVGLFKICLEKEKGTVREVEDLQRKGKVVLEVQGQADLHLNLQGAARAKDKKLPAPQQQAQSPFHPVLHVGRRIFPKIMVSGPFPQG